ncbi:MAG: amino acid-binding protein [Chlamydiae bacterium]|nr:amino acid-binding protein [Chlamydiota bacterium]MBI3266335.1 amino acid-binding protein [Chlamydiota bacterium]
MNQNVVMTALGQDRPGIVAAVSKVLYEVGCNLEDSSMTILEGEFAMILVVSLPEGMSLEILDKKLESVRRSLGLSIFLKSMKEEETRRLSPHIPSHMISVYGIDKPGIVYQVSDLLAQEKVNITDVNTKRVLEGTSPLYMMMLEVALPKDLDEKSFQKKLEDLGHRLSVTITFHPIETMTL